MKRVLITACDDTFSYQALNLIGSIQATDIGLDIVVYDLGLSPVSRQLFEGIKSVKLKKVPAFVEHWRVCYTWKPWVMIDAARSYDTVLYIDAGTEFLQSPQEVYDFIKADGYFLVSQRAALKNGHILQQIIPTDYYNQFKLSHRHDQKPVVAAGLLGFETTSQFYKKIIQPWLKLVSKGYNLGWSKTELSRNHGIHFQDQPSIRDCALFRHDQTILNLLIYSSMPTLTIQSMERFGTMHKLNQPGQIMWSPKIHGSFTYISQLQYEQGSFYKNLRNRALAIRKQLIRIIAATK